MKKISQLSITEDITDMYIDGIKPDGLDGEGNPKYKNYRVPVSAIGSDGEQIYDLVIRTRAEFEDMIADGLALNNTNIQNSTWHGAKSVALIGEFTLDFVDNGGVKIPDTVKQIHGYNGAKITITNFAYNSTTAKAGLWYDEKPEGVDCEIRNLEVDGTGSDSSGCGFSNCTNLTNCIGRGTGISAGSGGYGFYGCESLINCIGTGTSAGTGARGYGFFSCTNLINCIGTGTSTSAGATGYGFYNCSYANGCKAGSTDSSTSIWGGTNLKIDEDSCEMDV